MFLYIVIGLSGAFVVLLLFPAVRRPTLVGGGRRKKNVPADALPGNHGNTTKTCPLCHTILEPGERIKSVVYKKGGQQHGTITEFATEIYGCPHCYPANSRHPRICPVCGGEVNADGYLIARMLERKGRKPHVRVLGCTACRRNRTLR